MRLGIGLWLRSLLSRASSGSTLLNGLVSYWPLNEQSGVRYDVVGSNHLTDNNTVGSVLRGPEGTVASIVNANSESLTATITPPASYTLSTWIKLDGGDADGNHQGSIAGLKGGVAGSLTYASGHPIYGKFFAMHSIYDGTGWFTTGGWAGYGAVDASPGWQHVVAVQDGDAKTISVFVDGLQVGTTTTYVATSGSFGVPETFILGEDGSNPYPIASGTAWNPFLGPVALYSRVLTSDERTALFASGNGLRYSDLSDGLKTGLVSWWELDEVSGVRYDSHGSNDLTDNNTVGSATSVTGAMDGAAASFVAASTESLSVASFNPGQEWTASYWCRLDASSGTSIIFEIQNIVYDFIGIGQVYFFGTGSTGTFSYAVPTLGEWQHHLLWSDGTKVYIQLNGGTVQEDARVSATGANALNIGRALPSYYTTGRVDEVAIWSRVLTADERAELYALGAGKFYPFS